MRIQAILLLLWSLDSVAAPTAVDPVTTPVAAEGVVLRRAPAGWVECPGIHAFTPAIAILAVPANSKGWLLSNNVWIESANESAPSCAKPPAGVPPQPARAAGPINLAPGRYRVGFFSASPYGDKWSTPTTFGLYPPDPSPSLHAEIPAQVVVAERVLELWYPFLWPHDPRGNVVPNTAAIQALESVPKQRQRRHRQATTEPGADGQRAVASSLERLEHLPGDGSGAIVPMQ